MPMENLSQEQVERIITEVNQVRYWGFDDPTWILALEPLQRLKAQRNLTIVIVDNHVGRGIDEIIQSRSGKKK